ncbi:MAG: sugar phosphate nucleotidyltransferase [Clostridia bacterium]
MKCILLCAGYATRLFPLTENFPKSLLEVGNKKIIDYTLEKVNNIEDIDEIYLVTNAKYTPHFEKWVNEINNIKPISVINDGTSTNDDRLGAIGDMLFTVNTKNINDDIMVLATDAVFDFKLSEFKDFYDLVKAPCVCAKIEEDKELLKRVGVAELDENNMIIGFEEKPSMPKSNAVAYAQYIYPKEIIPMFKKYIDEGFSNDAPGNFLNYLYNKVPTYAYIFKGNCYDIGTHDSLKKVNDIYNNK